MKPVKKIYSVLLFCFATLAWLYVFVAPAFIASNTFKPSVFATGFGVFIYLQLWMLIAEFLFQAAAQLYGFRRESLFFIGRFSLSRWSFPLDSSKNIATSGRPVAAYLMLSYFWTLYGFAIAYVYISRTNPKAFNVGALTFFDASYFSLTTAATVGFGDIVPISVVARSFVMLEIVISFVYIVFFFSVLASQLQRKKTLGNT